MLSHPPLRLDWGLKRPVTSKATLFSAFPDEMHCRRPSYVVIVATTLWNSFFPVNIAFEKLIAPQTL